MNKTNYLPFIIFIISYLFSCSEDTNQSENIDVIKPLYKDEKLVENKLKIIDNNSSLYTINSLAYNKNDGSTAEVIAYLDSANNELKIEELFSDHVSGNYGKKVFYIEKGKVFASKEIFFNKQLKKPSFVEYVSYYNKIGSVLFTKYRKSFYEDDLEEKPFIKASKRKCSIVNAMSMLNQEGKFISTFQGFIENDGMLFLLVGENKPNGYTAALFVEYADRVIRELQKNEKELIGTPLDIQYDVGSDINNMTYRLLIRASFIH